MKRPVKTPKKVWIVTWRNNAGLVMYRAFRTKARAKANIQSLALLPGAWVCDEPIGPYTLGGGE